MVDPLRPDAGNKREKMTMSDKLATLRAFIGPAQRQALYAAMRGEEGDYFRAKVTELIAQLESMPKSMPKVYEQDGKDDQAVVYLHYFNGSMNWYITERDTSVEQLQAFGYANLGDDQNAEMGYISIDELIRNGVELDLYWTPVTLEQVKLKQAA